MGQVGRRPRLMVAEEPAEAASLSNRTHDGEGGSGSGPHLGILGVRGDV